MKALHKIAFVLVIIGALNWLLVGIFTWDVGAIFGGQTVAISRIIYILVGLSALVLIFTKKSCKSCNSSSATPTTPNQTM